MPHYQFPLQQLLNLRETAEEAARRQLSASEREANVGREHLAGLHEAVAQTSREAAPTLGQIVAPDQLLSSNLHLARLRVLTEAQQAKVERLVNQEQAHREQLVEKARSRQVIERLKERGHEQHRAEQTRRETQQLEEAGTMVFMRHRANASPPRRASAASHTEAA